MSMWHFLVFYVAAAVIFLATGKNSSPALIIFVYPLIGFFPALFLFALISPRPLHSGGLCAASLMLGPLIFTLICVAGMMAGLNVVSSIHAGLAFAALLGLAASIKNRRWTVDSLPPGWIYVAAIGFLIFVLVAVSLASGIRIRLSYHGWFHTPVAYNILRMGIPPEDPIFPGAGVNNYWLYHTWLAIVSAFLRRPPPDASAIVNLHSLTAVMAGTWLLGAHFFNRKKLVTIAFVITMMGMNSLGFIYALLSGDKFFENFERLARPSSMISNMIVYGDKRLGHFLSKFINMNGFPIGMSFYVCALLFTFRIIKKGPDRLSVAAVFLSTLGAFLFHPTTGMGMGIGIGLGWIFLLAFHYKTFKWELAALAAAMGFGVILSAPYLFSIFPSEGTGIKIYPRGMNISQTLLCYAVMIPLLVRGFSNLWETKDPAHRFLLMVLAGTLGASFFIILPGNNQYKFVRLLAFPAALVAAAAFMDERSRPIKRAILWFIISAGILNTAILGYAYMGSKWAGKSKYSRDGMDIILTKKATRDALFYDWVRKNTDESSVIVTDIRMIHDLLILTHRQVITAYGTWVSMGHKGSNDRKRMVRRIYGKSPIREDDLTYLGRMQRPVYFFLSAKNSKNEELVNKFESRPDWFKPVYNKAGYRLYLLVGK